MPFVTLGLPNHDSLPGVSGADHHQDLPALSTGVDQILVSTGAGVFLNAGPVNQAVMEAGTSDELQGMTALRVAQAITAQAYLLS